MKASGAYFFFLGAGAGLGLASAAAGYSRIGAGRCCFVVEIRGLGVEEVDLRTVVVAVAVVVGLCARGLVVEDESLTGGTSEAGRRARDLTPRALLVWEEMVVGRKLGLGPDGLVASVTGTAGVSLAASENFLADDLEVAWAEASLGVEWEDFLVAVDFIGFLVVEEAVVFVVVVLVVDLVVGFVDEEVVLVVGLVVGFVDEEVTTFLGVVVAVAVAVFTGFVVLDGEVLEPVVVVFLWVEAVMVVSK